MFPLKPSNRRKREKRKKNLKFIFNEESNEDEDNKEWHSNSENK